MNVELSIQFICALCYAIQHRVVAVVGYGYGLEVELKFAGAVVVAMKAQ